MTNLKQRLITLGVVFLIALLFLYPTASTVFKKLSDGTETATAKFENWISKPLSLGLDLSGGAHLVYKVVSEEAVTNRLQLEMQSLRSRLRTDKLPVTKARVTNKNTIELTLLSDKSIDRVKSILTDEYRDLKVETSKADNGRPLLTLSKSAQAITDIKTNAVTQAVETLRTRVDSFGVSEPIIQRVGDERILLQMPGVKDVESVKKVVGRVAKLEFRLLSQNGTSDVDTVTLKNRDGTPIKVESEVRLTGAAVDTAQVNFTPDNQVEVALGLTKEGGKSFGRLTGENVGRNLAIILDGEVYSAPNIRERIGGGRCSITGGFTMDEARELAVVLRAGALPASLEVMEERTVGPSLGKESIRKGVFAILIGFALILLFMSFYYKKSGLIASGILILNVVFILGLLSAFGATLTLPGLAGLALTVGMAVDANVIIFERIREELRNGAGRDASVASGFEKAFSAIIDSNVTTLISGLILYYFGSGPVRGFAVTLCIGIVTTIFCATFVARLGFDYFELKGKNKLSI